MGRVGQTGQVGQAGETGQMGQTRSIEIGSLSAIDFNHGAPATAVISSAPSIAPSNMVTGIGSGANAASQVVINGDKLNVPSQTVLEFRIQEPMRLDTGAVTPTP